MSAVSADHDELREDSPRTYYEDAVRIPGMREPPNRCRGLTPVGVCDYGHTVLGRSSCGTRYCEDHWRDWCEDAVVNMVAQFAAYRWHVEGAEARWHHLAASPPQDRRYSLRELWETRSDAYDALEAAGVRGGAVVVHPYRTNDRGNNLYETAKTEGDVEEDTGRWKFLRETADDWDELARYVKASPHYHALGAAPDVDGEAVPGDWIVKRLQTAKAFHHIRDTEAYRDMVAPAYYVLTHAADQPGRQTTTYFGAVHSFNPEEELTASEWHVIQREAEKAVKEYPEEDGDGSGPAAEECPREECEALVHDVMHLPELLEDDDWVSGIRSGVGGRARYNRLMGVLLWWEGRCDNPPPAARDDEARFREWLEEIGAKHVPDPSQVSLSTAVMG